MHSSYAGATAIKFIGKSGNQEKYGMVATFSPFQQFLIFDTS